MSDKVIREWMNQHKYNYIEVDGINYLDLAEDCAKYFNSYDYADEFTPDIYNDMAKEIADKFISRNNYETFATDQA